MTTAAPAVVRVSGALNEALTPAVLGAIDEHWLRSWLMERRWFGEKAREPQSVRIAEVIPLTWAGQADAVARVEVDAGSGRRSHYQLPLALRPESAVDPAIPLLATVESARERGVIIDGSDDPDFRRNLGMAFAPGARFGDAGARWSVEPLEPGGVAIDSATGSRVVKGEQSNTSIIYGNTAILKLFRRLEPGINPDVEIGRFLTTRVRFPHTPRLLGTIAMSWQREMPCVAGMLQRFLPDSRDAWTYALERVDGYLRGAPDFVMEAAELGRITRELHEALASVHDEPDFAPEPADSADVRAWARSAQHSAAGALELLGARLETLPPAVRGRAGAILGQLDELMAMIGHLADAVGDDAGARIRHHGDYHLGQVLRTGEDRFVIIDFEGEPSRPLAERRARHSALRDVAGMFRSFSYAAASAGAEHAVGERPSTGRSTGAWEQGARDAFLSAYLAAGAAGQVSVLPRSPASVRALISLFEMEKVCYELGYELNNRPSWVWIPLAGIGRILEVPDGTSGR